MKQNKYIVMFSIAALLVCASVLAADKTEWTSGNFHYTKTEKGVKVTEIKNPSDATSGASSSQQCIQQCISTCTGGQVKPANQHNKKNTDASVKTATPPATVITSQALNINSAVAIPDIDVGYGTALASVNLPTTASFILSDNTTQSLAVTWDGGTPTYDANTASTYTFSGTPTLSDNITNSSNLLASVNVVVAAQVASTDNSSVDLQQTTSPSTSSDILQQASASLLNGVGNLFNFILLPFKSIFKR